MGQEKPARAFRITGQGGGFGFERVEAGGGRGQRRDFGLLGGDVWSCGGEDLRGGFVGFVPEHASEQGQQCERGGGGEQDPGRRETSLAGS